MLTWKSAPLGLLCPVLSGLAQLNGLAGLGMTRGGASLTAPTLAVDSPVTNPPTFTATIDLPEVGDVIRLQLSLFSDFSVVAEEATNTLDGAEVADGDALFTVGTLASGDWYARVRQERGGVSAWSASETFTIASSYTEAGVSFGGTAYLDKTGDFAADPANLLIFVATQCPATLVRRSLISQASDEGWGEYNTASNGFRLRLVGTSAATFSFFATPDLTASAGQRLNILIALQPSGAKMGWTAYYRVGTGAWTLGASSVSAGDISLLDMSRGSFRFGAQLTTGLLNWNTTLYRHAVWSDITIPDISNAGVQANFADATTAVTVDPATSVAAYGTPRFDVYGPAADYNALINHGAVGNFTSKTGTFT